MCGVLAIQTHNNAIHGLYNGLIGLQHRGQDAAGVAVYKDGKIFLRKELGLVRDVFHTRHMRKMAGASIGIGHVRYPTAGNTIILAEEAQPFFTHRPAGIALAHNGNLINMEDLRKRYGRFHCNTDSDSEILLGIFSVEIERALQKSILASAKNKIRNKKSEIKMGKEGAKRSTEEIQPEHIFSAVKALQRAVKGAYSVIIIIAGKGILGFRDPFGIRPLVLGSREGASGKDHIIASESSVLDMLEHKLVRDIAPGEAVFIDTNGKVSSEQCVKKTMLSPCIFEYIYLARPDSIFQGVSVHEARAEMGRALAEKIREKEGWENIDVVISVPETSRDIAPALAHALGAEYAEGFYRNKYEGRTFIMPNQEARKASLRRKLRPVPSEFNGRNVLLVDDSIVRGTTSREIVRMARECGAKKVYFVSASPPIRFPNIYGIDIPSEDELIAHEKSEDEIRRFLGADGLVYQDLSALENAVRSLHKSLAEVKFENSIFTGKYLHDAKKYLTRAAKRRGVKVV